MTTPEDSMILYIQDVILFVTTLHRHLKAVRMAAGEADLSTPSTA